MSRGAPEVKGDVVRALYGLLREHRPLTGALVVVGVLASLAEGVGISLFIPLLQTLAVEPGVPGALGSDGLLGQLTAPLAAIPRDQLAPALAGLILASVLLTVGLRYLYGALLGALSARTGRALRSRLFSQLLRVGYGYFERAEPGRIMNTLGSETWRTVSALTALVGLFIAACTAVVYASILVLISWRLTALAAVTLALSSAIARLVTRRVRSLGEEATEANAVLSKRMTEGVWGMETIRLSGRERYEQTRFDRSSDNVARVFFKLGLVSDLVGPVYEIAAAVLLVGVLVWGVNGPADLPPLLVFIFVLYRLKPRAQSIDSLRLQIASLGAAVRDVHALLDRSGKPYTLSGETPHAKIEHAVRLDGVTFTYLDDKALALDGVTLDIPAGKTTALVGPSGAGKSTLVKLLFRLYDPVGGAVTVDGRPLSSLDLSDWRGRAAFVSQDVHLFDGTVRENIAYGRDGATDAEVRAAARAAHADAFIDALPSGYDTPLGDRGVRLSGGQRQRIALARAVVRDPDLLLLDEATNALDARSERVVQDALETFSRGRTTVVVAHRLSTVEQADHIVVLDEGRVAEQGTLEELVARGGLFAELYRIQHPSLLS